MKKSISLKIETSTDFLDYIIPLLPSGVNAKEFKKTMTKVLSLNNIDDFNKNIIPIENIYLKSKD